MSDAFYAWCKSKRLEPTEARREAFEAGRDELEVEGLAAQLCANDAEGNGKYYAWWHVMREDLKEVWRSCAREKIRQFKEKYPHG